MMVAPIPQTTEEFNECTWLQLNDLACAAATNPELFMFWVDSEHQMEKTVTVNNVGTASTMRITNIPELKKALPDDLTSFIKTVKKLTGTNNKEIDVSETEDDLFLLSLVESIGTSKDVYSSNNPMKEDSYLYFEGKQYEYFINHPTYQDHIIYDSANRGSVAWFRSSYPNSNTYNFCGLNTSGYLSGATPYTLRIPVVAFAFGSIPPKATTPQQVGQIVQVGLDSAIYGTLGANY